jgi:hypothetical protein
MTRPVWKLGPDHPFDDMSDEDFNEFERVWERFSQARELWKKLSGRDWHVGVDGQRYGREEDGSPILTGPHFDPAFLAWMRAQGELDDEDLADGEDIYPERVQTSTGYWFGEAIFFVPMEFFGGMEAAPGP